MNQPAVEVEAAPGVPADSDLLRVIRSGDTEAFARLYERHATAARAMAAQLVRGPAEIDDVVSEAFAKVLDLLQRGGGPADAFRPYLLTAVRRAAYDRYRLEHRQLSTDSLAEFDPGEPFEDPAVAGLEQSMIARAFRSLPERWQAVLWHTEIEASRPAEIADLLGLSANSVAALAHRAREGLRQAYLQMHLSGVVRQDCRPIAEKLGGYVRAGLSARDAAKVSAHLDDCTDCWAVCAELSDVNGALRGVVALVFLGPLATGYLSAVTSGGDVVARLGLLGRFRQVPKPRQAALAGGAVAAAGVAAAAVALATTSPAPAVTRSHQAAAAAPAHRWTAHRQAPVFPAQAPASPSQRPSPAASPASAPPASIAPTALPRTVVVQPGGRSSATTGTVAPPTTQAPPVTTQAPPATHRAEPTPTPSQTPAPSAPATPPPLILGGLSIAGPLPVDLATGVTPRR
jgi:RNA polymerase sigma factor (sigma-70 family)